MKLKIVISNSSKDPIYNQIFEQIKNQIIAGKLKENDSLPSIRGLSKDLRVSVITIKRTYDELERSGYIYTLPAKGSFVSKIDYFKFNLKNKKELENDIIKLVKKSKLYNYSMDDVFKIIKKHY